MCGPSTGGGLGHGASTSTPGIGPSRYTNSPNRPAAPISRVNSTSPRSRNTRNADAVVAESRPSSAAIARADVDAVKMPSTMTALRASSSSTSHTTGLTDRRTARDPSHTITARSRDGAALSGGRAVASLRRIVAARAPHQHQAVAYEETPGAREGEVVGEMRRGYRLGERLLRPALVRVAKAS